MAIQNAADRPRHLACAHCGTEFTADEGTEALTRKRRLQAHQPADEDPDATRKAFLSSGLELAEAYQR